ncbi:hypothetical protein FRC09_012872 [Ceratobasidium sp. 395]|nr:hypothetical protein FRC09_012872 [Ceratobasidium sp. 395]
MATARGLTEGEVASGFYHCLITAIKDAKRNDVLDNTDLASGDEQWLVIYGLSLHLLYSAKLDTTLPSIELSCPEDSDRRLDASASPPEFRPYFDRWASLIPRIRPLPQYYTHDLALLICRKLPITLPREFPDPLPFFPTPEQQALEDIRELSSKLNMISNAISQYGSFSPLWKGKLRAALSEESQMIRGEQVPAIITDDMTLPEVVAVLVRHSCPNITRELMFSSSATHSLAGSRYYSNISRGTLRDMSQVAIGFSRSDIADSESENERLTRTARGVFAWSLCHHPNVLPLIGLAEFRGQLAMVSPWMNNGNISDYVNKQPGADRFNLCTQIACGLTYLHSIGVVHVDVKGTNILMSDSGVPMLGGFANSISTNSAATVRFLKLQNGTETTFSLRWAAPEILRGSNPSMAADVYALGMASTPRELFDHNTDLL